MTFLEDFPRSVKGAWRLFVWDAGGVQYFDQTIEGFWRSFLVPFILAPFYYFAIVENHAILMTAIEMDPELAAQPMAPLSSVLVANFISYAVGIVAFPILMVFLARMLRLTSSYVTMIIAYNWGRVIIMALIAAPLGLHAIGVMGMAAVSAMTLLAVLVQPFYLFSLFRASTQAPGMTVLGLVVFELVLTVTIGIGIDSLVLTQP